MRVSFLLPGLHYGGVCRWMLSLGRHLRHCQIESIVSMGEGTIEDIAHEARGLAPVFTMPISVDEEGRKIYEGDQRRIVQRACGKADAVIVSACGILPNVADAIRHCARIVVSHVTPEWGPQADRARADEPAATHLAAVSQAAAACFTKPATILESGAEVDRVVPTAKVGETRRRWGITDPRATVALYVGRVGGIKNSRRLLDALHHLPEPWHVVFLGATGSQAEIQELKIRAAVEHPGRVILAPADTQIGSALAAADCLVITSQAEATPLVLLEAMLARCPVVTTDYPAIGDMTDTHGGIARIVAQDAHASDLADAIRRGGEWGIVDHAFDVAWQHYTAAAMAHRWERYLLAEVPSWQAERAWPTPVKPLPGREDPPAITYCARRQERPKVVFLMPAIQPLGGVEIWLRTLIPSTPAVDWEIVNLTHPLLEPPDLRTLEALGCPYFIDDTSTCHDANLVIAWGVPQALRWLRGYDGPLCLVAHGNDDWQRSWVQALEHRADGFVAVSEQAATIFGNRATIIPNGLDFHRLDLPAPRLTVRKKVREVLGVDAATPLVGFVGRMSPEKNPLLIANAVKKLGPPFRAVFAGRDCGSLSGILAANKQSIIVPQAEKIGELYAALDCVVVASPAEGFSYVTVEALYAGCPLVSTPVGVLPEIEQRHGQVAIPLPIGATPEQAAEAIKLALSRPPVNRQPIALEYSIERMAAAWQDYIAQWTSTPTTATAHTCPC